MMDYDYPLIPRTIPSFPRIPVIPAEAGIQRKAKHAVFLPPSLA